MLLPAQSNAGVQFCPKVEEALRLSSCPGNGEGLAGLRRAMDGRAGLGVDVGRVCCWQGDPGAKHTGVNKAPGLFCTALWVWRLM